MHTATARARVGSPSWWWAWLACALLLLAGGSVSAQALAAAAAAAPAAGTERRIALVIGNARYAQIPLNNPENDARVMAATLRRLGFDVQEHVNLPVKRFRQVVRDYVRRLQNEAGVGLFYYAGHGVQIDGKNYLMPVDINLGDEEEVKDEAVDIEDLFMSKLSRAKAKGLIVVLDACRDNPFKTKTRNIQTAGGLAEMGAPGAFIAYSAAPGAAAEDGPPGTNSVFTRHLAYEMLQPGVEIETAFKNVRVKTLRDTNRRQMPWTNSSLTIDFQFNPQASAAQAAGQAQIKALQEQLDRREAEQRRLEAQLAAMQRQLQQGGSASATPSTTTAASPLPSTAPVLPPRETTTAAPPPAVVITSPTGTAPVTAAPTIAAPPIRREPEGGARPGVAGKAAPTQVAARRPESERCVELQVRASLGEPVSNTELQKECRR